MKKTKLRNLIFIILLAFFATLSLTSQNILEEKYKLAQSFERNGDFVKAEEIYQEIYLQNKNRLDYFFGLARCKKALNKFSELVPLVEEQLQQRKNLEVYILAGEVHWKLGNIEKAKSYWRDAIKEFSNNDSTYIKISTLQSNLRQFDLAIETLLQGRKNLKSDLLFSEDLIKLYLITNRSENLVDEVLRQFEQNNDLNWAQAKVSLILENKEARNILENRLRKGKAGNEIYYKYLYAWFLYSLKDYEQALKAYIELDEFSKSNGYEVYRFGYTALNDGEFDYAMKSFEYVISLGKKSPYFTNAIYGIAKATDSKLLSQRRVEISIVKSVIKKYEDALKELSNNNSLYFEVKYRLAQLYASYLGEFSTAEKILVEISKSRYNPMIWKTNLLLGDIHLFQYRYLEAERKYKETINSNKISKPLEYYLAILKLGKLNFYQSLFDTAQYYFSLLIEDAPADISNEALERSIVIEKYKQYTLGLTLLAQFEFLSETNKFDSALVVIDEAKRKTEGTNFEEYLTLVKIRFANSWGLFGISESEAKGFINKFPQSIFLDEVVYLLGLSQYQQQKNLEALNTFTELITKFPRSIFNPKARLIINSIRKKES